MKKIILVTLFIITTATNAQSYLEAKRGIAAGDDIALYKQMKHHPLYPYLAAGFYQENLDRTTEIIELFDRHFSAPPVKRLLNRWVDYQYQLGDYQLIARHYYDTGDSTTNCLYRNAQLQLGNRKAALDNIEQTWLSAKSLSEYCTPVFAIWNKSRNKDIVLKRVLLAYRANNVDLATRLAERIGNSESATLAQFGNYLHYPETMLNASVSQLTGTALHRQLLPKALKALVRKDSVQYAGFAMQFASRMKDNDEYQEMLAKLTGYLANRHDSQAQSSYRLLKHPNKDATRSLLRYLVSVSNWRAITQLISINNNDPMALYWLGRALEAKGKKAKKAYRKAARIRSYYGFLAADKLNSAYQFNVSPIRPNNSIQNNFAGNTTLNRVKALYQQGETRLGHRELFPLAERLSPQTLRQLAYWLSRQQRHFEAIYILGKARDWDAVNTRFPTPYNVQVETASRLTGTESTWIYAILRQESSMNPLAVSRSNAKGLMQLIPSTARMMARDLGLSLYDGAIFDPSTNTKMGAKYLADMYSRFGSIALASAAYNAGPGRVEQWLVNNVHDMPAWVEKIPFNETRKYVKHVLEYQQVYAYRLGKKIPRVTQIMAVKNQPVSP
ncbi:MAG: hypothetical protein CSA45_01555 [Gammaproteobacteria bacterium]|nr:MAG: hypothetical protein CSA45_01555 [Gammaproteobacteria bacterium]